MNKLLIFDLDGTLVPTQLVYSYAIGKFQLAVLDELGSHAPHIKDIGNAFDEIDRAMVNETNPDTGKLYGFSHERFAAAMQRCMKKLCHAQSAHPDIKYRQRIARIAHQIIEPKQYRRVGLMQYTKETLNFLSEQGDSLVLLTKSEDERFQREKIKELRLSRWFPRPIIVQRKTKDVFTDIIGDRDPKTCFSIGDSFLSDIEPALEAGLKGLFVPSPDRWSFEKENEDALQEKHLGRYQRVWGIGSLMIRYEELLT